MFELLFFVIVLTGSITIINAQTLQKIDSASQMYNAGKWEQSVSLYKEIVETNPYNPDYKVKLAFSLQRTGNFHAAIEMYKKALDNGAFPDIYWYQIAICYARLKDSVNTISAIEKCIANKWPRYEQLENERDFSFIKNSKKFRQLLGLVLPDNASKADKWKADFFFMKNKLENLHYNVFNKNSSAIWKKLEKEILQNISKWSDERIVLSFMKYAALAGEGHTKILPPKSGDTAFYTIPIVLYQFADGFYVTECMREDEVLVGKKVNSIGGIEVEELFKSAEVYWGHDNDFHHKKITPKVMLMTEVLYERGLLQNKDPITISYADEYNKKFEYAILPQTIKQFEAVKTKDKSFMLNTDKPFALYQRNTDMDYWFESDKNRSTLYLKIKYILNQDKITFTSFIDSVFKRIDLDQSKYLILDLRDCGGGNATLNRYLIEQLIRRPHLNTRTNFYTIIGRNTYSAAVNLVGDLEFRTNATLIGEPTGSSPNYIGESNTLKLPYSRLYLIITNRYHQTGANNSLDKRKWYAPNIFIEPGSSDYKANNDPVINFIYDQIAAIR